MTIGERIKSARKQAGMTQQELADRLETSYVGISLWESGKRRPKQESLKRIAEVLNIPVAYFTEGNSMSEQEVLDFISWAWPRLDYQSALLQQDKGTQEDAERWERVCNELQKIHDEIVESHKECKKPPELTEELSKVFSGLNTKGQKRAVEWIKELAKIPEYQQSNSE